MNALWYYGIGFAVIWIIALVFKNKLSNHGVEVSFPILMWKTKRLRGLIDRLANIFPKFWRWFMNVGVVVSFGAMAAMTYLLLASLQTITETPSVSLIIPGVEIPGSPIFIPFAYGIIALATVLIVHEFAHGILARVEKIKLKSIGLLLFAILPGAFVEPDEEDMEKAKKISRMRVYAAGSISNLSVCVIFLLITLVISAVVIPATFHETGVEINRVIEGTPADNILQEGMIIQSINGHNVTSGESYSKAVSTLRPGKTVNVITNTGNYSFIAGKNPNNASLGYMGVKGLKHFEIKSDVVNTYGNYLPWIWFTLLEMFKWIFLLNLGIGMFNLLPMKPLDGGHLLEELLDYILPENIYKPIVTIVSFFMIFIIAINLIAGLGIGLS